MNGRSILRVFPACIALIISVQSAFGWWNYGWEKRRTFVLNNSGFATSTDTVTILITITPADSIYPNTQAAGQDIRFVDADDATQLDHEIELWDTAGTSFVWVQVPDIADSTQPDSIWFYYHNTFCADGQDTVGTWDGEYVAVWHMNEDTATGVHDRTVNNNDEVENIDSWQSPGLIGYAREFEMVNIQDGPLPSQQGVADGTGLNMGSFDIETATQGFTMEAWFLATAWHEPTNGSWHDNRIIEKNEVGPVGTTNNGDASTRLWMLSTIVNESDSTTSFLRFRCRTDDGDSTTTMLASSGVISLNNWYYGVARFDGNTDSMSLWLNGEKVAAAYKAGDAIDVDSTMSVYVGTGLASRPDAQKTYYKPWEGLIDEVRISNTPRPDAWITSQFRLLDNSGYTASAEEQGPPTIAAAEYHSSGTDGVNGDSLTVTLSFGILDATLPASPDGMFGIIGLGGMTNATLTTGSVANDNIVVVKFSADDTILCHNRTQVVLYDSVVTGPGGKPCIAGTVDVTTYNVMNAGTGTVYQTLNAGYADAAVNDSLLVFDAGEYPETLTIDRHTSVIGYGIDYPGTDSLPVVMDPGNVTGGYNALFVLHDSTAALYVNLVSLKFVSTTDSMRAVDVTDYDNRFDHTIRKCVFNGSGVARECMVDDFVRGAITVDSCEFTGYTNMCIYWRHDDWGSNTGKSVTNCHFHDINGPAIWLRDSREFVMRNNIFEDVVNGYGIVRITASNTLDISGNVFRDCGGSGYGTLHFDWNSNTYSLDNNIFTRCWNPAGAIAFHQSRDGIVFNNLITDCTKGFGLSGGDNSYRNLIVFNTVVNCTTGGFSMSTNSTYRDTFKYNIVWQNGSYDLNLSAGTPVADFNFYDPGRNLDWPVGAHTDSGYPAFVDTAADNFRLSPSSPCIDFTDVDPAIATTMGVGTDLDGNSRSAPAGTYADAGCFEEQVTGVLRIRNVDYWACGTETVGDDTMKVLFQHNLDDGTVPTGAGNADAVFGNVGLGSMDGATIYTSGIVDTNFLFIRLAAGDTVFSHLRSGLRIDGTSTIRSELGFTAQTDTVKVNTYNVHNTRTGTDYATIRLAMESSVDADTVKVFDEGYYTDTLHIDGDIIFTNTGTMVPVIKYGGDTTTLVTGTAGKNGFMVIAQGPMPEFHGFEFDGSGIGGSDRINNFVATTNGRFSGCTFHHADNLLFNCADHGTNDSLVFEDCVFYSGTGGGVQWEKSYSTARISRCMVYNCGTGIGLNGADSALVENCRVYGNTSDGFFIRNARANTLRNNLVYGNGGTGIELYNDLYPYSAKRTLLVNNSVYGNGAGGMEVDSLGAAYNNISYGNTGWDFRRADGSDYVEVVPDSVRWNMADSNGAALGTAFSGADGNVVTGTDPLFVNTAAGDFHLRLHSPAIDRGGTAADYDDYDGSRCDMGAYGGPYAVDNLYPHRTDTLIVVPDQSSGYATDSLYWGSYSLGDFALFAVYRDTFAGFVPSQANCIDSLPVSSATGVSVPGNGKDNVYKVSVANDTMYGGGYRTGACAKIYFLKTSDRTLTVPGDTITYTLYYDNDGDEVSVDVFTIIDELPDRAEYLELSGNALHTGGTVDVDWYDGSWQETQPGDVTTIRAVRWEIQPGIGAHDGSGDASGEDQTKTGMDMNGGTDAGQVSFKVIVR